MWGAIDVGMVCAGYVLGLVFAGLGWGGWVVGKMLPLWLAQTAPILRPRPDRGEHSLSGHGTSPGVVVVLGGGFGGVRVARSLGSMYDVILVDDKAGWEFTPSIPRIAAEPGALADIAVPHASHGLFRFVQGRAVGVGSHCVSVASAEEGGEMVELEFDYLVVATGARYAELVSGPNALPCWRGREVGEAGDAMARGEVRDVVVVGGGIVGVELAAELVETYPDVGVVLAHSGERLMSASPSVTVRAAEYAERFLSSRGVRLALGERVVEVDRRGERIVLGSLASETEFEADMVFVATGIVPNTEFLRVGAGKTPSPFDGTLDARGFVQTTHALNLPDHPHIFVLGDILARPGEKLAQVAEAQADVVAANISRLERGRSSDALRTHVSSPVPIIVSLGKYDGLLLFRGWTLPGTIAALGKAFVERLSVAMYRNSASSYLF